MPFQIERRLEYCHTLLVPVELYGSEQDIILFPDSLEAMQLLQRVDGPPKCANGLTFCESIDEYPENRLKEILVQDQVPKILFGEDQAPNDIVNRIGDDEDTFVCRSIKGLIFPKMGLNKDNLWKLIINLDGDDGFVQGVTIETCYRPDEECDVLDNSPVGIVTFCRQKYIYRKLMSVNEKGKVVPDSFRLPSACCCAYKQDQNFLSRFGKGFTPSRKLSRK
ncbi:protein spaetzle-like isoform X2 [Cylas formicarius]|uniref:protein spaetzle-like isoform X2 n=1 Tax=Cylas formicarius TaxID=197179 RepID=UPI0029586FA7|nr:protein spaetzle-like isoform X2 [Cylas formicarius]